MAYGEIEISGRDVYEALIEQKFYPQWGVKLNEHGEKLADLIVERAMQKLVEKLGEKGDEGDER